MQEYDNDYYEKRKHLYDDFDKNDDELNEQYNKSTSSLSEKKSSSSGKYDYGGRQTDRLPSFL